MPFFFPLIHAVYACYPRILISVNFGSPWTEQKKANDAQARKEHDECDPQRLCQGGLAALDDMDHCPDNGREEEESEEPTGEEVVEGEVLVRDRGKRDSGGHRERSWGGGGGPGSRGGAVGRHG